MWPALLEVASAGRVGGGRGSVRAAARPARVGGPAMPRPWLHSRDAVFKMEMNGRSMKRTPVLKSTTSLPFSRHGSGSREAPLCHTGTRAISSLHLAKYAPLS